MKRLFKKMIPIMALLIVCTTVLTCLYGCTGKNSNRFDTDLFCCMYNEDKTGVIILELTEKGQEQEILVIPEEINGLPVVQLGGTTWGYPYNQKHFLKSNVTKKMYVDAGTSFGSTSVQMSKLKEVIVYPFTQEDPFKISFYLEEVDVYIVKGILNTGYFEKQHFHPSYNEAFKEANTVFYSDNEVVCFIDNYSPEGLYIQPQVTPKEGYIFSDWYMDKEYCTIWDKKYPQEGTMNIYAKWIEE